MYLFQTSTVVLVKETFIRWYQNRPNPNSCLNLRDSASTLEKSGVPDGGGTLLEQDRPIGAREEEENLVKAAVEGVKKSCHIGEARTCVGRSLASRNALRTDVAVNDDPPWSPPSSQAASNRAGTTASERLQGC
jgi:hypothetical protein